MSWWCSAQGTAWTWEWRAYPGVWLFLALLAVGVWRWNRAGAAARGEAAPSEAAPSEAAPPMHPAFVGGLAVLWLALDWPIGALGAGYLASVHMVQFLLMALVAPPLLLQGPSREALALLEGPGMGARLVRPLVEPRVALFLFSAVVLLTHLPAVVDSLMATQWGSMLIDLAWIAAGVIFWWPVIRDQPAKARFAAPLKIGYLVLGIMFSPIMFGLVGFLVYSETPLYGVFELAPPMSGLSAKDDHQLAGVLMSVGGAAIAFVAISVIFFRWSKAEA